MTQGHQQTNHGSGGYDKQGVDMKQVLLWTAASVIFIVVSLVLINSFFVLTKEEVVYQTVLKPPSVTLRDLRAREDASLTAYKLLDPAKGVYQIPIDRAMALLADEAYRASATR